MNFLNFLLNLLPKSTTINKDIKMEPIKKQYFSPRETSCRCGCGLDIEPKFLVLLNKIREDYGKPISLTSAKRCQTHNDKIGGAKKSAHIKGLAADLVRTLDLEQFIIRNLVKYNLRMESLDKTPTWIHISSDYSGLGPRIFRP
jgi:hypothetical protein